MKKFLIAAVAASLVATPAMAAAPQNYGGQNYGQNTHQQAKRPQAHNQRGPERSFHQQVRKPVQVQYRNNWQRGQRFESRFARNYRQVDYRQHRNLKAPPRGYHYVQSGNDAVLVGVTSGIIAAIFANILR